MSILYKPRALQAIPVKIDGADCIILNDPAGYSEKEIILTPAAYTLLLLTDFSDNLDDILTIYKNEFGHIFNKDEVISLFEYLDEGYFLDSPRFKDYAKSVDEDFKLSKIRALKFAGKSYPADKDKLALELDSLLNSKGSEFSDKRYPKSIIVPHIDFSIGKKLMADGWKKVIGADYKRILIIGTGHLLYEDFFSVLDKDLETPFGTIRKDSDFIKELATRLNEDFSSNQIPHKNEHSIEFQSIFAKYLFKDKDIPLVAILLSLPDKLDLTKEGHPKFNVERVERFFNILKTVIEEADGETLLVASVDFAHVGTKFGDNIETFDDQLISLIKNNDRKLLDSIKEWDKEKFKNLIAKTNHDFKVCGFAPIYATLSILSPEKTELIGYDYNLETESKNLVSYATLVSY